MAQGTNIFSGLGGIDVPPVVRVNRDGRSRAFSVHFLADGSVPHIRIFLRSVEGDHTFSGGDIDLKSLGDNATAFDLAIPRGMLATGEAQLEILACKVSDPDRAGSEDWVRVVRRIQVGPAEAAEENVIKVESPEIEPPSLPLSDLPVSAGSVDQDMMTALSSNTEPTSERSGKDDKGPGDGTSKSTELNIYFKRPQDWGRRMYAYIRASSPPGKEHSWTAAPMGDAGWREGEDWYVQRYLGLHAAYLVFTDGERRTPELFRDRSGYYYTDNCWYDENPERASRELIGESGTGSEGAPATLSTSPVPQTREPNVGAAPSVTIAHPGKRLTSTIEASADRQPEISTPRSEPELAGRGFGEGVRTMPALFIQLVSGLDRSFTCHVVGASFFRSVVVDPLAADASLLPPVIVAGRASAVADAAGLARLVLPAELVVDAEHPIRVQVRAPDGEVLAAVEVGADKLDGGGPVTIDVDAKQFPPIEPSDDPAFGKPARLRGLLVDPSGRGKVGGRQVVLSAQPAAGNGAAMRIVAVARTDGRGYFFAPYPLGTFTAAEGSIDGGAPVAIRLDDDGSFPERVVLGVELAAGDGKDKCACEGEVPRDPDLEDLINSPGTYTNDVGAGHCVDFTKPNRILEEFDFHTVVRTTEPEIRGLTVTEPPKVGLGEVLSLVDPKISEWLLQMPLAAAPAAQTAVAAAQGPAGGPDLSSKVETLAAQALIDVRPELQSLSEAMGLASLRLARAQPAGEAGGARPGLGGVRFEAGIVKTLARDPDGFSLPRLAQAEIVTRKNDLARLVEVMNRAMAERPAGRGELTGENPVDWDEEPTFYQACTIAHGHILHLKQQWVADGYSLGDLLYSLPLAPCQKKQIVTIDWDRRESAVRRESLEEQELLTAQLSHDREINEIAKARVRETLSGNSEADTISGAVGIGVGAILGPVGGLLGIGGGASSASSQAIQRSSRDASASSLQQLRDRTMQAASAVRSQRVTVIQTVQQGETMRVETEVVANHNHCHAITIEYFEVLRHFLVRQHLADVQECLFVPLLMTRFDQAKTLRWREPLARCLRDRRLLRGFDALQRIADHYVGSDMPIGSYAEEQLVYLDGFLNIQFRIRRPHDDDDGNFLEAAWAPLGWLGITPREWWRTFLENQQERDRIFAELLGPRIAEEISNGLRFFAVDGADLGGGPLPLDPTLVSKFRNDAPLHVSLRLASALPPIRREQISSIRIDRNITLRGGSSGNIDEILPAGSKIIVRSGQMGYRTPHLSHDLFNASRLLNDDLSGTDGVLIATPLSRQELRRPREEDKQHANLLLKHLNDHLEYYHRCLWTQMDAQRRYMLLDGFIAPNSGGRSVASVVENRLIGIVGNCLVMPVARGFHLDCTVPQDPDNPIDLLERYQPLTPIAPLRIAVPTKGVFAEAVMGACNSCEEKDESRFWRWEESPCPDEPTPIQPVSTESRRAEPPDLTPTPFPQPIVAFQNVPAAPDPQGIGALTQLLANPNLFRDVTGLTENQRNALAALQSAFGTAQFFGGKAADLALQAAMRQDIDKALMKINREREAGTISPEKAAELTEGALRSMIGGGTQKPAEPMTPTQVESLTNTAGNNDAAVNVNRPGVEMIGIDARPVESGGLSLTPAVFSLENEAQRLRLDLPSANELPPSALAEKFAEIYNENVQIRPFASLDKRHLSKYIDRANNEAIEGLINSLSTESGRANISYALLVISSVVARDVSKEFKPIVNPAGFLEPQSTFSIPRIAPRMAQRLGMFLAWIDIAIKRHSVNEIERIAELEQAWAALTAGLGIITSVIPVPRGALGSLLFALAQDRAIALIDRYSNDFEGARGNLKNMLRVFRSANRDLNNMIFEEVLLNELSGGQLILVTGDTQIILDGYKGWVFTGWDEELELFGESSVTTEV